MRWQSTPVRARRPPPAAFVPLCQPILSHKVPEGPQWQHEVKYDGYRMLARRQGDRIDLWSRHGLSWTQAFMGVATDLSHLAATSIAIDGEMILGHESGLQDFHGLRSTYRQPEAVLVAFDLLELDGSDLRSRPLVERRALLEEAVKGSSGHILFSEALDGPTGSALLRHACAMGLEGIVSKRLDAPYRAGRDPRWLKIKCPNYERQG
ncbi:hypothetical protein ABEG18_14685 [Alsobacter sp. KACC 23698]|uniref:ATP-dependent DNA ligase family profile domain-containing protein n=1 Tax=Alsobacter sp. KACC 23698 TaxID=3149229 RepID=A0AAU7J9M5_9HYPH